MKGEKKKLINTCAFVVKLWHPRSFSDLHPNEINLEKYDVKKKKNLEK